MTTPQPHADVEQYEVKAIRSHRHHGKGKQLQYLVKWLGYPKSNNTWEPAGHLQALALLKEYHRRYPLSSSIRRVLKQPRPQFPSWLPHHIALAATTPSLTTQLLSGISPCQHGTWTPMLILPNKPPKRNLSTAKTRRRPSLLNTTTPMPPFPETPCANTIDKACPETPTHPLIPQHPLLTHPPSLLLAMMATSPSNSSMNSTLTKPVTSRSCQPHPLSDMSPTPPLCLYKRSAHLPHSRCASHPTPKES